MAILASRTRTGISWISESIALFKQSPRKWMLLALVYLGLLFLPSMPGLQVIASLFIILIWPVFIAVAMRLYRNTEVKEEESLSLIMQLLQPNMRSLLMLGFINLFYFIVVNFLLLADFQALDSIVNHQGKMSEQETVTAMQTMMPILFKLLLVFIPLLIINWFSPMLIAFNQYSLIKAIKSSIAGCLQYIVALIAAWLLLSAALIALMMVVSVVLGLFALVIPVIAKPVVPIIAFGCFLVNIALTLAFQYVSYRDVFRAA